MHSMKGVNPSEQRMSAAPLSLTCILRQQADGIAEIEISFVVAIGLAIGNELRP